MYLWYNAVVRGEVIMEVKTGYLYHIMDEYFDLINDEKLMLNHEKGHSRPTYFAIKDSNILWFIPVSSKVSKYKKIVNYKVKKYGECKSIIIGRIMGKEMVILVQNAFPTLEKYIDHEHVLNGVPVSVSTSLQAEILACFKKLMHMKRHGVNLFFTDIDGIKKKILKETE